MNDGCHVRGCCTASFDVVCGQQLHAHFHYLGRITLAIGVLVAACMFCISVQRREIDALGERLTRVQRMSEAAVRRSYPDGMPPVPARDWWCPWI